MRIQALLVSVLCAGNVGMVQAQAEPLGTPAEPLQLYPAVEVTFDGRTYAVCKGFGRTPVKVTFPSYTSIVERQTLQDYEDCSGTETPIEGWMWKGSSMTYSTNELNADLGQIRYFTTGNARGDCQDYKFKIECTTNPRGVGGYLFGLSASPEPEEPSPPPPSPPPPCPDCSDKPNDMTIYGIVHGSSSSTFWQTWEEGARTALPECTTTFVYRPTDYSVGDTVAAIQEACAISTSEKPHVGVIVTIPYETDTSGYSTIVDAVNACARGDVRFELSNTDTAYDALAWDGYAGSFNYILGDICGRYAMTDDLDLAVSGEKVNASVPTTIDGKPVEIYLMDSEKQNFGIQMRKDGLQAAIGSVSLCGSGATTNGVGTAAAGEQCSFPFTWDGVTYDTCTKADNGRLAWCYLADGTTWGNCDCEEAFVPVKSSTGELGADSFVIALGVGAYNDAKAAGKTPSFQCGDDRNKGEVQFYGQTVYTQGLQAAGQMYGQLMDRAHTAEMTGAASGAAAGGFLTHPFQEPSCPLRVTVVTHGPSTRGESAFWDEWSSASSTAAQDFAYTYIGSGMDAGIHVEAIRTACGAADELSEDALVVTVPYAKDTPEYTAVDNAINECLASRPSLPIVSTNTDTYHNPKVLSYVGSDNYAMGKVCALAAFTSDEAVLRGSVEPNIPSGLLESVKVYVYQGTDELTNEGLNQRFLGIQESVTLLRASNEAIRVTSIQQIQEACVDNDACFVITLDNEDMVALKAATSDAFVDFMCGDDLDDDVPHYGQHVWSQGLGAVSQAITGARAPWPSLIGNARQIGDPLSVKPAVRCYPEGLRLDFEGDYLGDTNNLGGSPDPGIGMLEEQTEGLCTDPVPWGEEPPPGGCLCGCGCGCTDFDLPFASVPQEMHLRGVGLLYDGTSNSPSKYLDLIVTNTTLYTPWKSTENGRKPNSIFGEISMAGDTSTTFKFEFVDSDTGAAAEIPYGAPPSPQTALSPTASQPPCSSDRD